MRLRTNVNAAWHALCQSCKSMNEGRESARRGNGRRIAPERGVIALLLAGIMAVLALPARHGWQPASARASGTPLFQVTEADFLQPKFASARAIQALNCLAAGMASFGGYDEFTSCVRYGREAAIAKVTRFSGSVLALLDVRFIARAQELPDGRFIYISEKFWERAFGRSPAALGATLNLHGFQHSIAGIVRATSSLLAGTDVWLPAQAGGIVGGSPSLRVIGGLRDSLGWKEAQARLLGVASQFSLEFLQDFLAGPRFVPLDRGIYFGAPERDWFASHGPALARLKRAG